MRSLDEHLAVVLALVARGPAEDVYLADALGRIAASDHLAFRTSPAFDNSAMDGYAVRAADLALASESLPVSLVVVGEARAGAGTATYAGAGTALRIMTGAPLPMGADSVVAQEIVDRDGATARFSAPTPLGSHVRRAGEDVKPGDLVVPAGTAMGPRHLAGAAASGLGEVRVVARPRVGYLVTGDELVAPGGELTSGQIHDSNGTYLQAALAALGALPVSLGRVGDDPDAVLAAVRDANVDLVVTTGGASVGDHDPVKAALASHGVAFAPVAMQPGKPQGAGRVGATPVVCLPGNPVAVAVCIELFVGAAVRAMLGVAEPAWRPARAAEGWTCPPGREQIMPVTVDDVSGEVRPATSGGSGSHLAGRLATATALARVAADVAEVEPGDTVLVRRFTA